MRINILLLFILLVGCSYKPTIEVYLPDNETLLESCISAEAAVENIIDAWEKEGIKLPRNVVFQAEYGRQCGSRILNPVTLREEACILNCCWTISVSNGSMGMIGYINGETGKPPPESCWKPVP